MNIHDVKKSFYSGVVFFSTVVILSVGYGALFGGLSTADRVGSGSGLTATAWNRIVDGVLELDTRTAHIFSSGGNVGIGTVNPQAKLQINQSVGTNAGGIKIINGSITHYMYSDATGDFHFNNSGQKLIINENGGNVGIGTTTPRATLDVNGAIRLQQMITPPYVCDVYHWGEIYFRSTGANGLCYCDSANWRKVSTEALCN